jgi:hypothetical protein
MHTPSSVFDPNGRFRRFAMLAVLGFSAVPLAQAWVLTVNPGPKTVYLQVGNGSYSGLYTTGGTPLNNPQVNVVSVTVPAASVGRGTSQQMTSDSTQSASFYDNYAVCNPPAQVYIGGWARLPSGTGTAVLSATSPANLLNGTATIPFTTIRWTSTANGNATADIPAGTFTGGTQTLTNIAAGTWVENCLTFFYANTAVVRQGIYKGRVTYSLSLP